MDEHAMQHNSHPQPMSVEEAKKVMWLRSNYKSMGALLEEGYLTRDQLAWAAAKAWNPRIKEAAKIILATFEKAPENSQQLTSTTSQTRVPASPVDVEMTVSQAEKSIWPFQPYRGQPMGSLVKTRKLTLKDLGYAIENARERRISQAATVLMLTRLNQAINEPDAKATYTQTISGGRSHTDWKQLQLSIVKGMVLGTMCTIILFYFAWLANSFMTHRLEFKLPENQSQVIGLAITGLIGTVGAFLVWKIFTFFPETILAKLDRAIQNYQMGEQGEDKVADIITQTLDGNWTLFRNVTLPGRNKSDIDMVLLGPAGIWSLEVKNLAGEYKNIGEHWESRIGRKKNLMRNGPSSQAQSNARRLANFLRADKINQWVEPVVVWANQQNIPTIENPAVPVWLYDNLPEELGNIWQKDKISQADMAAIKEKLTKLCDSDTKDSKG